MNRRSFFKFAGAAVAGIALEQAIPLGRVWSFPKQIAVKSADFSGFYDLIGPSKPIWDGKDFDIERDYYVIKWPVVSREWTFGTYVNEVLKHYAPLQNMKAIALEAA